MLTTGVFMDIIAMHRQGLSMRSIAKKLGIHRNTVKTHIEASSFPRYREIQGINIPLLVPYQFRKFRLFLL